MTPTHFVARAVAPLLCALPLLASAQSGGTPLRIENAWARFTTGQQSTGVFLTLTAAEDSRLVGGSSPLAGSVEVHEMRMDGEVMRMRAIPALALPAGQAVALKPGGYHVMLMGLKKPLAAGSTVPLTLVVEGADKQQRRIDVSVPVRKSAPVREQPVPGPDGKGHEHHGHEHGHGHGHDHKH